MTLQLQRIGTGLRQLSVVVVSALVFCLLVTQLQVATGNAQDATASSNGENGSTKLKNKAQPNKDEQEGSEIPLEQKGLDSPAEMFAEINRLSGLIKLSVKREPGKKPGFISLDYNDPFMQRQRLIWQYYNTQPGDPNIAPLMDNRWRVMTTKLRSGGYVMSETLKVMQNKQADETTKKWANYWHAYSSIQSSIRSPIVKPQHLRKEADKFISLFPDEPRGASLLGYIANRLSNKPEEQMKWYRQLGKEFPQTFMGQIGAGKARQVDDINKPFTIEFDDLRTGRHYTMDDFKGKVVVIDFMATACKPCMKELPEFVKLKNSLEDKRVEFIAVSLDRPEVEGGKKAMQAMIDELNLDWPVYFQGNQFLSDFSKGWGINSIPVQFVVDQHGILRSSNAGIALEAIVKGLLNEDKNEAGDKKQ